MVRLRPLSWIACCLALAAHAEGTPFILKVTGTTPWRLSVDAGALAEGTRLSLRDGEGHLLGRLDAAAAQVTLPGPGTYQALLEPLDAGSQVDVAITGPTATHPCAAFRFKASPAGLSRLRMLSSCTFRILETPMEDGGPRRWTLALADEVPCRVGPQQAVPAPR